MLEIGDTAPDFALTGTDGMIYTLGNYKKNRTLVVFFTGNNCPYLANSLSYVNEIAKEYASKDVAFVAINSNIDEKPQLALQTMEGIVTKNRLVFPYLQDPTQRVADKYKVENNEHFFIFDRYRFLVYTGRLTDNLNDPKSARNEDLKNALSEASVAMHVTTPVTTPMGPKLTPAYAGAL